MQIVTTHKNTDFDALASVIAATILYPDAIAVLPKAVNPNVKAFLSLHKDLLKVQTVKDIELSDVRRLIVVDTNAWKRLDRMEKLREAANLEIHLWDHHADDGDIAASRKCQEQMGATVTLLIRELKKERKLLTPIQATLFLAGIYEDTGNLTFPSARAEDAYAVGFLLDRRADLSVLSSFLRPAYGEMQKNVLFEMLQSARRSKLNGYTVSINICPVKGHVGNLSIVVQMYRDIINVDAAFGIFHDREKDRCMIIGRSNAEGLDMGDIMRALGGGGHPGAGSVLLKSIEPKTVTEKIRELIQGHQKTAVQISDLMSFPIFSVESDTPMKIVASLLRTKGVTGIPVVDHGKLAGIISRRDFRRIKRETQLTSPVKAFMSREVKTIAPDKSPAQAARLMVKHDIGRLPVIENGRIIGILTRSDAMRYFYDLLPD
jgi:tRNA nucleotidyltransferase (CCA-adding enzyme)